MRYLTSALVSEGVTDDQFLPRLLARALTEICLTEFEDAVEVADVQPLRDRRGPCSIADVIGLVEQNPASFSLIFHHDQGANAERTAAEWLRPLRELWGERAEQLVAVVPVRETEAWLLADGDALRSALGVRWTDAEMGLPAQPRQVERVADPKSALNSVMQRVSRSTTDHYGQLGELVSLARLEGVPAYQRWWTDTRDALVRLGYRSA